MCQQRPQRPSLAALSPDFNIPSYFPVFINFLGIMREIVLFNSISVCLQDVAYKDNNDNNNKFYQFNHSSWL